MSRTYRSKVLLGVGIGFLVLGVILMISGIVAVEMTNTFVHVSSDSNGITINSSSKESQLNDPFLTSVFGNLFTSNSESTGTPGGDISNQDIKIIVRKNPVKLAGQVMLYSGVVLTVGGIAMIIAAENKTIKFVDA